MTISDMYDINKIILNVEQALCIDGSDYGEKDVDTIIENVTNRIIKKYQIDLSNKKISDDDLYIGKSRSSAVLFIENVSNLHATLAGYAASIIRYNRLVTVRPVNMNYMGFTSETLKSFYMAALQKNTMPSIDTAINAIKRKFGSINSCTEKKFMLIIIIAYQFGFYELVAILAEILYHGMQA